MHILALGKNRLARALFVGSFVLLLAAPVSITTRVNTVNAQGDGLSGGAAPTDPASKSGQAVAAGTKSAPKDTSGVPILTQFGTFVGNLLLYIASFFTYMGGMLLEFVIKDLVLGMGTLLGNGSPMGTMVNDMWVLIRDICNLAFIFGFIYIGLKLIIDADDSGAKRQLAQVIVAALLINFSLFFTKIIIDFGNLTAVEIHTQMISSGGSISTKIADVLGVVKFYETTDPNTFAKYTTGGNIAFYLMAAIFLLIAAFVLAAGGILLIVRFVALIFIMIFSPVLFAATIFPQTEGEAKKLWKKLINYSFFAPIYLLLLLLSIKVLEAGKTSIAKGGKTLSEGISNQGADAFSVVVNFTVSIFFLIMSLQIANKLSVIGGDKALAVGQDLRKRGQKMLSSAALYAPRAGARLGIGYASKAALNKFDKWQASSPKGVVGKYARKAMELTDADRSIRGTLEAGKKAKFGLKYSYDDNTKYAEERQKRTTATRAALDREEAIERASNPPHGTVPTPADMDNMVKAIKGLTTDQMKDMDLNILIREDVAVHLSTKQIEELEKSGKYSDRQITDIKEARKKGIRKVARGGGTNIGGLTQQEVLARRGADEIAKMPIEVFTEPAMMPYLTPDLVESKMRAGVTNADLALITSALNREIASRPLTDPYRKQWEKWDDRSPIAARLGLIF